MKIINLEIDTKELEKGNKRMNDVGFILGFILLWGMIFNVIEIKSELVRLLIILCCISILIIIVYSAIETLFNRIKIK